MLNLRQAAILLLGCAVAGALGTVVPNHYIVEFSSSGPLPRDLKSNDLVKVVKSYDSPIFNGALIQVEKDEDAGQYASSAHVANMWPNRVLRLDKPVHTESFADDASAAAYSVHGATGVDKLHAAGILGQGVKVGVVDSGIWYPHPALGGGFGPGFKVAGGWDFAGDSTNPNAPKQPDADPLDTPDVGHGTHVAGIVAGVSDNFVGVAPNATLYAYKVFAAYEGTDEATLIDAWLRAYDEGMDVITTSISSLDGWSQNPSAVVVGRIARSGVVMTFSAGNNGQDGPFYGADAASSPDVLAVASVEAAVAPASPYQLTITLNGVSNTTTSGYLSSDGEFPVEVKDWPVVPLNLDPENIADACEPYPAGTRNLTGVIPLVRRGGCDFTTKQQMLQALGATYVFCYNDDRPITTPGTTDPGSLLVIIPAETGHAIIKAVVAGANVTADFSNPGGEIGIPNLDAGNTPNFFSSWASTYDLQLKPDIGAPGGDIFSTWPEDSYMVQSGTSMAAPYIAGIAALYISALGGRSQHGPNFAAEFNRRVVAAGLSLVWFNNTVKNPNFFAPPMQMGGGLVNAPKVLYSETTVDTVKFALNDTQNFEPSHDVTVTNNGGSTVTYNFTLEPAAGVNIQNLYNANFDTWGINTFKDLIPESMVPDVQLPDSFQLGPGESKTVTVTFANPGDKGWNATLIPAYSGKVILGGDNGDQLSLLYMGIASSLYKNKKVFKNNYPNSLSGIPWTAIDQKSTYTFNLTTDGADYPMMFLAFDWGYRELRWDVSKTLPYFSLNVFVSFQGASMHAESPRQLQIFEPNWPESDWTYPPSADKGFIGATTRFTGYDFPPNWTDPTTADQTAPMPLTFQTRQGLYAPSERRLLWFGRLANGSMIATGNYTMRVAVSRPFADLNRLDGWEIWRHEITVLPKN
ncbi:minor extracellular protease vpr [Xylariaceae sp. FL1651]|nr:minor extracellular protease vpr [Xylariaceae sp. FL1651]